MVMKCYKDGDNTKINVTIVPTYEFALERYWRLDSFEYKNFGYYGSVNITVNNKTLSFDYNSYYDAIDIWFHGNSQRIKTGILDVTNVGSNQPVKSPIPPLAIALVLITIPIIALRKLN